MEGAVGVGTWLTWIWWRSSYAALPAFAELCAGHVEGAVGVWTWWTWTWWSSRPEGEERNLDMDLVEILLVLAGSRGPSTVQLPTMEPGSGPGSRWSPPASEDRAVREEGTWAGGSWSW